MGSLSWNRDYGQRFALWDASIEQNRANANGSRGILRNSVNYQDTWGAISKLRKIFNSEWTAEVGVDWRTSEIAHYREVRDLLGGAYFDDCARGCRLGLLDRGGWAARPRRQARLPQREHGRLAGRVCAGREDVGGRDLSTAWSGGPRTPTASWTTSATTNQPVASRQSRAATSPVTRSRAGRYAT